MKNLLLVVCGLLISSSSVFAKGWNFDDYQEIVGAGHAILGTELTQQRKQATIADKEVVRLMTELGLDGGKFVAFVAFAGEGANALADKKKRAQYQARRRAKRTQTNAQLQFANASYRLDRRALNKIGSLARTYQIAKNQIKQITIKGHTNSVGSGQYNLELSHNRAASVKAALLRHGVPNNIIRIHGYGETQPLRGTNAAAPINRRVEYEVLKNKLNKTN